jgi:glyoxylate/hydroxypyruvate reductase
MALNHISGPFNITYLVADLSVMLALMASRNAAETISVVQNGEVHAPNVPHKLILNLPEQWPNRHWSPFGFCGPQLSVSSVSPTRTIGFIGFGRISKATLKRLVPFGVTHCVYYSNPLSPPKPLLDAELKTMHGLQSVKRVDLDELAKESDFVFVLAPGGDKTRHLVNAEFLRKMKKTAIVVNTSRGTLVDSNALAAALRHGLIWGAGLDVVEGEPEITADHPLVKEPRYIDYNCQEHSKLTTVI